MNKIKKHADENVEILLIGNKIDLVNDVAVQHEEALKMAESRNLPYFEASAKDSLNVDRAFKQLLSNVINNEYLKDKISV